MSISKYDIEHVKFIIWNILNKCDDELGDKPIHVTYESNELNCYCNYILKKYFNDESQRLDTIFVFLELPRIISHIAYYVSVNREKLEPIYEIAYEDEYGILIKMVSAPIDKLEEYIDAKFKKALKGE